MNLKKLTAIFKTKSGTGSATENESADPQQSQAIYHCCVQKSGSQWIKDLLSDRTILKATGMKTYVPNQNFMGGDSVKILSESPLPVNKIITPLYINYNDFYQIPKADTYRAFFVMRDPRDILISWYFSTKFSHKANPYITKQREILQKMENDEAISYLIKEIFNHKNNLFAAMNSWYKIESQQDDVMVIRFENLIGPNQAEWFKRIIEHLGIHLDMESIQQLLKKYSFKKLSRGRDTGNENVEKHYRKGISGDWKNYFNHHHIALFNQENGKLLTDLEYE